MAYQDPSPGSEQAGSTTEVAKEQAGRVGQTASQAGGQVAQTTKEQAQNVVGEAKQQARDLVGEARTQVRDQAGSQRDRAVQGLRAVSDELTEMSDRGGQSGLATEVARQASGRANDLAQYLERHEPAELLDEIRAYARRRPVMFLAGAALAGVVVGRLTKGLAAGGDSAGGRSPAELTGYTPAALPVGQPLAEQPPGSYGVSPGYPPAGYGDGGYQGAGVASSPAYPGSGYETSGYQPAGYEGAVPPAAGTGGFRAPDEGQYADQGQYGAQGQYGDQGQYGTDPAQYGTTGYPAGDPVLDPDPAYREDLPLDPTAETDPEGRPSGGWSR